MRQAEAPPQVVLISFCGLFMVFCMKLCYIHTMNKYFAVEQFFEQFESIKIPKEQLLNKH